MAAGMNRRCNVWRFTSNDDSVGGALLTGTVIHTGIMLRLRSDRAEPLLLQQGVETTKTFDAIFVPGTLDIRMNDEIVITYPLDDRYYGSFFRIANFYADDLNPRDPRNYIKAQLTRSERAHTNQ